MLMVRVGIEKLQQICHAYARGGFCESETKHGRGRAPARRQFCGEESTGTEVTDPKTVCSSSGEDIFCILETTVAYDCIETR
jgi:hypothetical protein